MMRLRTAVVLLILLPFLSCVQEVFAQRGDPFIGYAERTLFIRWTDEGRARRDHTPLAVEALGGRLAWESIRVPGLALVEVPAEYRDMAEHLLHFDDTLEFVHRDPLAQLTAIPNDDHWGQQYAHTLVCLPQAWEERTAIDAVIPAVIDAGMDYTHPDLVGNILYNHAELGNDEDGSGIIGDYWGASFISNTADPCWTPQNQPFSFSGVCDHGTRVGSTLGAVGNNEAVLPNSLLAGGAWKCQMLNVKAFGTTAAPASDLIKAMEYAWKRGSRLMNCSWIIKTTQVDIPSLRLFLEYQQDTLFIFGAGNDTADMDLYPRHPDCHTIDGSPVHWLPQEFTSPNLLVVGGSTENDKNMG